LGEKQKADDLALQLSAEMLKAGAFYLDFYDYAQHDFETVMQYLYFLQDEVKKGGNEELAAAIETNIKSLIGS
jgi:hypothetical protein